MTSRLQDWAERREIECVELSDIYDSVSSVEEFMLEVDQALPQCPKTLVCVFLMCKWLERHPNALCGLIVLCVVLLWGGPLALAGVFWAAGRHAAAIGMLAVEFAAFCRMLISSCRKPVSGKCWRLNRRGK